MQTRKLLGGAVALLIAVGCGSGAAAPNSPDQLKASAQADIDAINRNNRIPAQAKEQLIGHIQSNLKRHLAPAPTVPGPKNVRGS